MDVTILVVRIGLAAVLLVAGFAKMLDRDSTRLAIPAFGLPDALAQPIAIALPISELAVGALLVPAPIARLAAGAASLLFASFSVTVGLALIRGRHPECHCFGELSQGGINVATFVRSTALAVAAAFVVLAWVEPPLSLAAWFEGLGSTARVLVVVGAVLVLLGILGVGYRRRHPRESARQLLAPQRSDAPSAPTMPSTTRGPAVGTIAPSFEFGRLDGTPGSSDELVPGELPVLLLFMSPTCFACKYLRPHVARWSRDEASRFTVVVVSSGDLEKNRRMQEDLGSATLVLQREGEVDALFGVTGTPEGVLIGTDGVIASPLAGNALGIKAIVASFDGAAEEAARRDREPRPSDA